MNKLFTLLFVVALSLSSCKKDETIAGKDYTTYTAVLSLNSESGKMIPEVGPPPEFTPTGNEVVDYFFSVQHSFKLSDKGSTGVINSSSDYQDLVVTKNPETELEDVLPKEGDWHLMLTEYTTEEVYGASGSWYAMPLVGVLSNKGVSTANISSDKFESITLADAQKETFSHDVDNIGTKWQEFNMDVRKYIILDGTDGREDANTYLVKITDDEIYKFRFMDFYGDGRDVKEKGHITFQFELLK